MLMTRSRVRRSVRESLDNRVAEIGQIVRTAAGDNLPIHDGWAVDELCAGVDHIGSYRLVAGHRPALGDAGLDEEPRGMTDGGNRLLRAGERLNERDRIFLDPQEIGVDLAAGKHER